MTGPYSVHRCAWQNTSGVTYSIAVVDETGNFVCQTEGRTEHEVRENALRICDALNRDHALQTRRVQDPALIDGQRDYGAGLRITEARDLPRAQAEATDV